MTRLRSHPPHHAGPVVNLHPAYQKGAAVHQPMTLYVAGPMTGLPEFNYPAFNDAASRLREAGYNVLNPVDAEKDNPTPGTPQEWQWYMRKALVMVTQADGVALLPGWEESKGATLEVHVAKSLGLLVGPVEEWLA